MNIATIEVSGTYARIGRYVTIPAGIVGATVDFRFTDALWDGLQKTVVFRSNVTRDVLLNGTVAAIPHETVAKPGDTLYVGVYGVDADNNLVIPTLWTGIGGVRDAADPSGDPGTDPTLPIWAQLQKDVEDLKKGGGGSGGPGKPGADGGYYTPAVTQPDKNKIQFDFAPSKSDMPAVQPVQVELPAGQGSGGNVAFETDETLTLKNGILSVNTTDQMEQDNTRPITSAGVYNIVGNIEILLGKL